MVGGSRSYDIVTEGDKRTAGRLAWGDKWG
jgi:hypothetical protein